jgi:hypothetical protein
MRPLINPTWHRSSLDPDAAVSRPLLYVEPGRSCSGNAKRVGRSCRDQHAPTRAEWRTRLPSAICCS